MAGGVVTRGSRRWFRSCLPAFVVLASWFAFVPTAFGCSPPMDRSIAAAGPGLVVLLGTTGEPVPGGRAFHVEHYWNATGSRTTTIAFKEGEPIGDCSYPMEAGRRLIIAPSITEDGGLYADIVTPQADPLSPEGVAYLAEANRLFGPGTPPTGGEEAAATTDPGFDWSIVGFVGLGVLAVGLYLLARRALDRRRSPEEVLEQATLRAEQDRQRTSAIEHADRHNVNGPPNP